MFMWHGGTVSASRLSIPSSAKYGDAAGYLNVSNLGLICNSNCMDAALEHALETEEYSPVHM